MKSERCSKCGGEMAEGFLADRADNHSSRLPSWYEGAPEKGWFGALKVWKRAHLDVLARRCRKCGLLELHSPASTS